MTNHIYTLPCPFTRLQRLCRHLSSAHHILVYASFFAKRFSISLVSGRSTNQASVQTTSLEDQSEHTLPPVIAPFPNCVQSPSSVAFEIYC